MVYRCLLFFVAGMVTPTFAWALPKQVDLQPQYAAWGLRPKRQGRRGTCSVFAINGVLEFERSKDGSDKFKRLSEEYLNWASNHANGSKRDGALFVDAVRGLRMFGVCEEALMLYAAKYDRNAAPSPAAREDAEKRKDVSPQWIKHWNVKTGMTTQQLDAIRESLAGGHPVAIGMRWPKKERYDSNNVLIAPPAGEVFDGHSVVIVGYTDDPKQPGGGTFIFRNNSGTKWRDAGYARFPYAYVQAYGNDALGLRVGEGGPLPTNRGAVSPLEAEALTVAERRDCRASVQQMTPWGAQLWSGGAQLFCGSKPGGSVTLLFSMEKTCRVRLDLYATKAPDFGRAQTWLDGKEVGEVFDAYAPEVIPTGRIPLVTMNVEAGEHRLRFEAVGKNEASTNYFFGIDCIDVVPLQSSASDRH